MAYVLDGISICVGAPTPHLRLNSLAAGFLFVLANDIGIHIESIESPEMPKSFGSQISIDDHKLIRKNMKNGTHNARLEEQKSLNSINVNGFKTPRTCQTGSPGRKRNFTEILNNNNLDKYCQNHEKKIHKVKSISEPFELSKKQSILFTKHKTFEVDDIHDDETDNMFLEDYQLIYLPIAFKEFFLQRKHYIDWTRKFEKVVEENTKYREKDLYLYYDVPSCEVLVPMDEQEFKKSR